MSEIQFVPFEAKHIPAVAAFNERLAAHKEFFRSQWGRDLKTGILFPSQDQSECLPERQGRRIYEKYWLALDGEVVRGGYVVKVQPFSVNGVLQDVAHFRHPISEGIIDRKYASVGALIVGDLRRRYPLAFSLGLGGADQPMTKMLSACRWSIASIPLYINVLRPFRFLRQMSHLRRTRFRAFVLDVAAFTGIGGIAIHATQLRRNSVARQARVCPTDCFGPEEDSLWEQCASEYPMIGMRNQEMLNTLYPVVQRRFHRLRVFDADRYVGWIVVTVRQEKHDPLYGNLCIGLVVDHLSRPADSSMILSCAKKYLAEQGADLVTCHQSHSAWGQACENLGFRRVESRFLTAWCPALSRSVGSADQGSQRSLLTKGDGDGPTNLFEKGFS